MLLGFYGKRLVIHYHKRQNNLLDILKMPELMKTDLPDEEPIG